MIISKVSFNNFRPYYGNVNIDLTVHDDRNVIVVGGRNGGGKTSFHSGIVWCLYGKQISKVDDIYRRQVKGSYPQYRAKSLNWKARDEGAQTFSVTVVFENVELPESICATKKAYSQVALRRTYDKNTESEELIILINDVPLEELWQTPVHEEHQVAFIDDYLIPIQAAKFVFFDAEKIAEMAEMNLRQQGRIMSDALSKILGLELYEGLLFDLGVVQESLKKESASGHIHQQIESHENRRTIILKRLADIEQEHDDVDEKIAGLKKKISTFDDFLMKQGGHVTKVNIPALRRKQADLEKQKEMVSKRLSEIADLLPFSIAAGKLQEVIEHIQRQQKVQKLLTLQEDSDERRQAFLEKLFNQPPYPEGKDLNLKHKMFYYEKAEEVMKDVWEVNQVEDVLDYEIDLSKSDTEHVFQIYALVQKTSEEVYEKIFNDFQRLTTASDEIAVQIQKAESELEDDMLEEYRVKRETSEIEREKLAKKAGALESERLRLEKEKETLEEKIKNLLDKVEASQAKRAQLEGLMRYKNLISEFIEKQKKVKSERLGQKITAELRRLMHKNNFLGKAHVEVLPERGLIVELHNEDGRKLPPESLSQGEQQLYISCLLKAILDESISELPAFIDSPLARLDDEHKDNILCHYYPDLASQVVIFALNSEISSHKLKTIQAHVARTYLLRNDGTITTITEGYF